MILFVCVFLIAALSIDFIYTGVFWLVGHRPHFLRRYLVHVAWMALEAACVACLIAYLIRA